MKIALKVLFVLLWAVPAWAQAIVTDGDSLEIENHRIRLVGIDAPEYNQTCALTDKTKYDCGVDARVYLESFLAKGKIRCVEEGIDRYGRSLCECSVTERVSGKIYNLNEEMLKSGWAITYHTRDKTYLNAEKSAKKRKVGIWRGRFLRPELYRILQQ